MAFNNPYVGPRAFQTGESIYGRERETSTLVNLLMAERIVMLYSPSGAGKTSLIQAALIPRLRGKKFNVLPTIRVNLEPPKELLGSSNFNRYIFSVLNYLDEGLPESQRAGEATLAQISVSEYLAKRSKAEGTFADLLIFDQFEEILTLDPTDQQAKKEFFEQMGEVLSDRTIWALFSMREDYVAALDPYLLSIPTGFSTTFRMDLLEVKSALQAIQEPPRGRDVTFTDSAAQKLVDDLRKVRVQQVESGSEERLGPYIEPLQLQVVCYRLWEELDEDDDLIEESDLELVGDVNTALASYYTERAALIAQETGVSERAIRRWFDRQLITDQLIRGQVLMGAKESGGLNNNAIERLRDAHLVRAEKRRGATWYELAHDRLIDPIIKDNQAWYQKNLSLLQQQADLWISHGRSEGLLLKGKDLLEAVSWAAENELNKVEQDFLEACQKAQTFAEREKRNIRRIRLLALVSSGLFLFACLAFFAAAVFAYTTYQSDQISFSRELAASAMNNLDTDPELSVLLALKAVEVARSQSTSVPQAEDALQQALQAVRVRATFSNSEDVSYLRVEYSPDGSHLIASNGSGKARLWDISTGDELQVYDQGEFISSLAISPDGSHLAIGVGNGLVRIWEVDTGREIMAVSQGFETYSVAFSPTSDLLATSALLDGVIIWKASTGDFLRWVGSEDTYYSLDFNPEKEHLAAGGFGGIVKVWNAETGEELFNTSHGEEPVFKVAFAPDGRYLTTGAGDGYARVWDVDTGEELFELDHGAAVWGLAFSPDGNQLATSGEDGRTILWDITSKKEILSLWNQSPVRNVKFSPDGNWLATIGDDGVAILWEARSGEQVASLTHADNLDEGFNFFDLAFSPSQPYLATGGTGGVVRIWDLSDPKNIVKELVSFPSRNATIWGLAFSPDGLNLAVARENGVVEVTDSTSGQEQFSLSHGTTVRSVAYSPDGSMLAIGGTGGNAIVRDTATGKQLYYFNHGNDIYSLSFSPNGRRLATAGEDGRAIVWELSTEEQLFSVTQEDVLFAVAFSENGKWLATAGVDTTAHIWDADTGKELVELKGHTNSIFRLSFHPDNLYLATASADGTARIWNLTPGDTFGRETLVLTGHKSGIEGMDFSPDGSMIATAAWDGTIKLWDATIGHTGPVNAVAISKPDGTRLATASDDGMVIIWDVQTHTPIFTLYHEDKVNDLDFNPDGTRLATTSDDGTAAVWDIASGKLLFSLDHQGISVTGVVFNEAGTQLGTIDAGNKGRVWEAATGELLFELEHTDKLTGMDFNHDGTLIATSSRDSIKLWDAITGQELIVKYDAHAYLSWVYSIDFSPDGRYLATSSSDYTAKIWDVESLEPIQVLEHGDQVNWTSFSPDGKQLLTYEIGGKLFVWDPSSGEKIFDLLGHTNSINWITFSEDSSRLATAGLDKTIIIWDLTNGDKVLTLTSPSDIKSVALSPDGRLLAAGGSDNSVKIYPLLMEDLIDRASATVTRGLTEEECQKHLHDKCPPSQ